MSDRTPAEVIAAVLAEHTDMTDRAADDGCSCGYPDPRTYEAHVAAEVVEALGPYFDPKTYIEPKGLPL